MISGTFILLALFTVALGYFLTRKKKWKNSPPGPRGLPIVGNLFSIDKLQHISYCKWAKEYGPIFRVDLASTKNVVISDYKLVKEVFAETAFSGRMDFTVFDIVGDGKRHGIVNTEGEEWEELRRFTLRQLRDFGFGKTSMEESIMLEVTELIEGLKGREGESIGNIKESLLLAVVNSLWSIVTGTRHKQNDSELLQLTDKLQKLGTENLEKFGALMFAPRLAYIIPELSGYNKIRQGIDEFAAYFKPQIEQHKQSYSEDFERDFIDVYLKESRKTTNPNSAFYGKLGEQHLLAMLSDFYNAGSDTTSSTLSFMILYLSKLPEVQRKFQKEITFITGNSRPCSTKDRANMPYTEALLAETMRFSSILAQGVGHRAVRDHEFHGYMIPKDAVITPNLYYIHHDPKIWGDPENFRPERFLSADGTKYKKHEALMPFGVGRRQCLGEALARDSLFLFSTNIFQRFWFEFDKNGPDHGFESKLSFVLTPKPYNVILKDKLEN